MTDPDRAPIDRRAVISRHDVVLTSPDSRNPLSLGNGDLGCGVDITGLQTFVRWHDPRLAQAEGREAINTATLSTWGWHETPTDQPWSLADASTEYETSRGPVSYPDRFDMMAMFTGQVADDDRAGVWLNVNPHRLDLGRVGLVLGDGADGPGFGPDDLADVEQRLRLWEGRVESRFSLHGQPVEVVTAVHPTRGELALRVTSPLLADGLGVALRFPYASDHFFGTSDWDSPGAHTTAVTAGEGGAVVHRTVDATEYDVRLDWTPGAVRAPEVDADRHVVVVRSTGASLELVVTWSPTPVAGSGSSVEDVLAAAAGWWGDFWQNGALLDLGAVEDPRARELERRVVLSQYLTAVHCSGSMPPQETGLITNSWSGKSHLEMHWWHAAHFALWNRPLLLRRSIDWYLGIADRARDTARGQRYDGLRWPKQVGPEGRESPGEIGVFLVWQQPHFLYLLELLHAAGALDADLVERADTAVRDTAAFMVSFLEDRDGELHLAPPLVPAQEFYDRRTTVDPTFELAYWWWGIELAQRWLERRGEERDPRWSDAQARLARPHVRDGIYTAVAAEPFTKRDDHPSLLAAFGLVPPTPVIDPETMRATLRDVLADWDWNSTWGWDYPVLAMTATALGDGEAAVAGLLQDRPKNTYLPNGHNPQMGNMLPLYLPGNGGLLAAVALMVTGYAGSDARTPGFPASWDVRHEGFVDWPA